ncbi:MULTISPECIES: fla cluster protein FlaF [Haloferax]|uniref:Fla cluster protein FlaF n=2 Tax=Haloferax TaxID=2251 RepID=A0A6G1Z463_9EURY|nr:MULTISPECIES: fla cluster protein FlaF [Haloferax]KAB1188717.1 fla cluster protein FlaF [Haloferax sp. CBA1149]MRW81427.1 fla cluster protein FlaF [Haloferax marinisediminis]
MGFGVSGSTAIIFLGVLIATGTFYTATSHAAENLVEARDADAELALERQNTAISLTNATYDTGTLTVNVTNTGAETLAVDETTLLVDNNFTAPDTTSVDGSQATNLWHPGGTLSIDVAEPSAPTRVKLVTGNGVAATGVVS